MVMPTAGSSFTAYLGGVSSSDTQVQVGIGLGKAQTGGGTYVSVIGRRLSASTDYRVKLRFMSGGAIVETLERVVSGTEVSLASVTAPVTYTVGAVVDVALQVTGTAPTTVRSMIWLQGATQPTTWQLTTTDNTSGMQSPGAVALLVYLSGSATNAPITGSFSAFSATSTSSATSTGLPSYASIVNAAKLATNYYRTTYAHTTLTPRNGWSWSTYTQGVQTLFGQVGDQQYLNDNLAWGSSNSWSVETSETNPDTVKSLQTYYDLNALDSTASLIKADAEMASDLTNLPVSQYDWADALFMGLPDWTRWATRTGNSAYLDKMDSLYVWSRDEGATSSRCAGSTPSQPGLFSSADGLWYRDCTFVGALDANGKPIFWARGNGWVIAAMAQVLQTLPSSDSRRATYVSMLQTMAAALVPLQGSDGFWRASLADPSLFPSPETSGTALITYALAYGIQAGLLSSATYLPVVVKAWHGLSTMALQPSGFITDCQGNGVSPAAPYTALSPQTGQTSTSSGTVNTDEPPFCAGAFLLAGAQVAQLIPSPSTGRACYLHQPTGRQRGESGQRRQRHDAVVGVGLPAVGHDRSRLREVDQQRKGRALPRPRISVPRSDVDRQQPLDDRHRSNSQHDGRLAHRQLQYRRDQRALRAAYRDRRQRRQHDLGEHPRVRRLPIARAASGGCWSPAAVLVTAESQWSEGVRGGQFAPGRE